MLFESLLVSCFKLLLFEFVFVDVFKEDVVELFKLLLFELVLFIVFVLRFDWVVFLSFEFGDDNDDCVALFELVVVVFFFFK